MALLTVICLIVFRQLFAVVGLSTQDIPPYNYRGGSTKKQDWYDYIIPLAKVIGPKYGIPWQAMAVQTALETGWGESSLLRKYNNFGGIKAKKGQSSTNMKTQEYINGQWITITDGFATWPTPYKGLIGYANFFHENERYAEALKHPRDPYRFIEEIKKAGYATAPNYVSILHGMLKNDLKA